VLLLLQLPRTKKHPTDGDTTINNYKKSGTIIRKGETKDDEDKDDAATRTPKATTTITTTTAEEQQQIHQRVDETNVFAGSKDDDETKVNQYCFVIVIVIVTATKSWQRKRQTRYSVQYELQ